jgi:hypothetical protein
LKINQISLTSFAVDKMAWQQKHRCVANLGMEAGALDKRPFEEGLSATAQSFSAFKKR